MTVRNFFLVAALSMLAAACTSCQADDEQADADRSDASDARPTITRLHPDTLPIEGRANAMGVDPQTQTMTYCTSLYRVGFVDLAAWSVADSYDIHDLYDGEEFEIGDCRVRTIGDRTFVLFIPLEIGYPSIALLVEVDTAKRTIESVRRISDEPFSDINLRAYAGLSPSKDPNRAYLTVPRRYPPGDEREGTLWSVDLTTGELFENVLFPGLDISHMGIYDVFDKTFAIGWQFGPEQGERYALNLDTGEVPYRPDDISVAGVVVNETRRILALLRVPSGGMDFYDLDDGAHIRHLEYANPGFQPLLAWLPQGRIAHADSGSQSSYVTIMDEKTGDALAIASFEPDSIGGIELGADDKTLYVAGNGFVGRFTVPTTLP